MSSLRSREVQGPPESKHGETAGQFLCVLLKYTWYPVYDSIRMALREPTLFAASTQHAIELEIHVIGMQCPVEQALLLASFVLTCRQMNTVKWA